MTSPTRTSSGPTGDAAMAAPTGIEGVMDRLGTLRNAMCPVDDAAISSAQAQPTTTLTDNATNRSG